MAPDKLKKGVIFCLYCILVGNFNIFNFLFNSLLLPLIMMNIFNNILYKSVVFHTLHITLLIIVILNCLPQVHCGY